ncbi:MAG: hypothetical protein R3304_07570 [Longimicrobiales bacterium]|nr:hypothetical protein [Longimicrobiales bacterium]
MATRQAFIDGSHRDRASWLLDAHISVSTGLWRIPLLGDAPRVPIPPGDEAREFEELDIGAWDPTKVPQEGDIRILHGVRRQVAVEPGCHPIQETDDWLAVERLEVLRCEEGEGEAVREDFRGLGSARRHADRRCGGAGEEVTVFGWSIPG